MNQAFFDRFKKEIALLQLLLLTIIVLLGGLVVLIAAAANYGGLRDQFEAFLKVEPNEKEMILESNTKFWSSPDLNTISDPETKAKALYGKELIEHTSKYLGPNGKIASSSNGMNCQNCHLEAGTKVFGNNYGSVASTYPKFRVRSGTEEDIYHRVNDCFERSLNGKALKNQSEEMQAIKAYIEFLGSNIPKGSVAEGSGLKNFPMLDRPTSPEKGRLVYESKCQTCHKADGQGELLLDSSEYAFPPLWGPNSYNDAAGLYRITNFAKYVKFNMPQGADFERPLLSDEDAWDVAAFVNSQPRPHKDVPNDWPDISKKPIDHPFGPYDDGFTEFEHKFGPFKPIMDKRLAMTSTAENTTPKQTR